MVTFEYSHLTKLSKRLSTAARVAPETVDRFIEQQVADPIAQEMISRAPVRSGYLRDHIRVTKVGDHQWRIGVVGVSYARYVSEGTRPHTITAKNAQALRFTVQGKTVYAHSVHHPGTAPNHYQEDAVRTVLKRVLPRLAGIQTEVFKNG